MADLSKKEILDKAKELSEKYKVDVTPFAFNYKGSQIVGYLKDPDRFTKMQAFDIYSRSKTQAGEIILRTSLCPESDTRILSDEKQYDTVFISATQQATLVLDFYLDELKKNESE